MRQFEVDTEKRIVTVDGNVAAKWTVELAEDLGLGLQIKDAVISSLITAIQYTYTLTEEEKTEAATIISNALDVKYP